MRHLYSIVALATGLVAGLIAGYLAGQAGSSGASAPPSEPWLARVDDQYVTVAEFEDEMRRRGGRQPGRFHDPEQRRALLDELMYRRALVARARAEGFDRDPAVRRSLDQILINQVIQADLRPRQEQGDIEPGEIEAFYNQHAAEYEIPERRRVAMVFFELGPEVSEETRRRTFERARQVRAQALELGEQIRHFDVLAREHSDHQASRYRGGVLGWISGGDPERYSYPPAVIAAAGQMSEPGQISDIVEGENGLYLVRLVDYQPRRRRSLDELADGIRQRLLRERFIAVEQAFRAETLAQAEVQVRSGVLESIEPPGPPGTGSVRRPPPMPGTDAQGN